MMVAPVVGVWFRGCAVAVVVVGGAALLNGPGVGVVRSSSWCSCRKLQCMIPWDAMLTAARFAAESLTGVGVVVGPRGCAVRGGGRWSGTSG